MSLRIIIIKKDISPKLKVKDLVNFAHSSPSPMHPSMMVHNPQERCDPQHCMDNREKASRPVFGLERGKLSPLET